MPDIDVTNDGSLTNLASLSAGNRFLVVDSGELKDVAWSVIEGSVISGTGVAGQVAEFVANTTTLQAAKLIAPTANILTLTNAAAATLALNITAAKTLTLTAVDNYGLTVAGTSTINGSLVGNMTGGGTVATGGFTLTVPATGTAALLGTANVFTTQQMVDGTSDQIQLRVQAHSTQTTNLQTWENSSGVVKIHVSGAGNISIRNDLAPLVDDNTSLRILRSWDTAGGATQYASRTIANIGAVGNITADLRAYSIEGTLGNTSNTAGVVYGMKVLMQQSAATGNISEIRGVSIGINATGAGTITNAYGAQIEARANTGTVTNFYGLWIGNQTAAATLNYSIYTNAATNGARFGHQLDIVGSTDVNQLKVTGFTTQTNPVAYLIDNTSATNTVRNVLQLETQSTGTAAAGLGVGLLFSIETATASTNQNAGVISASWVDATNATRKAKLSLSAYDTAARLGLEIEASGSAVKLGFFGGTPAVQQVLNAYTSDAESGAYTGIDNAQAGTVYATVADLNTLRTAYETLRASYDDLRTKLQTSTIVG